MSRQVNETEKILPTSDQRAYEEWLVRVLRPFSAKAARRDVRALFDDQHDQRLQTLGLVQSESDVARLLRHLLRMRAFAEAQCARTLRERAAGETGGKRAALVQIERSVQRIYSFLARYNRAQHYNIDLARLSLNTFLRRKRATEICEKLRQGVQREIRHALHRRLALYLQATPIGGRDKRQFDLEPLLQFAIDKRLEHADDATLYSLYVDEQMRRVQRALAEQGAAPPADEDLGEEQFELMRGAPATPKPILTENNQTCIGPCAAPRDQLRKVCRTAPYRKYGLRYTWDYCD